ncbi:hypothetical protein PISL3812_05325 [Talaromyces islandicus]|uniref:BTB domain-containing protein n=1 Tax=Talaromyces islandicus TaxID=28573 RepID=A0A0U1LZH6_TALIS|nr:hypothetical protein PISL3812_05325 [Talaromyces islandicus]
MEGTFGSYITSPLFTFQIGPEKREFTVHSCPVSNLSSSLDSLMNGAMIEAKTRRVDWSDVDEDTFVRLCEYAYLHDYTPPSPHQMADCPVDLEGTQRVPIKKRKKSKKVSVGFGGWPVEAEPVPEPELGPEPEPELEPEPEKPQADEDELPYKEKSIWTRHLRDSFSRLTIDVPHNDKQVKDRFSSNPNRKDQDFTPVFLGHARLFVLADKYGIESLCQLVLSKVSQTLKVFTLYHQSVAGVIEFARFVYSETLRHAHGIGALRNLATSYIVSALGQLGDNQDFEKLLEEGGDFVADFWRAVWKADGACTS